MTARQSRTPRQPATGRPDLRRAVWNAVYVCLVLLIVGGAIFIGLRAQAFRLEEARANARTEAQRVTSQLVAQLASVMNEHALTVRALAAVVRREPDISQKAFEEVAGDITGGRRDGILNIALLKGSVITRVYPYERNARVVGADVTYVHAQLPGLNLTRRNRTVTQSGPYKLVQGGKGLIYRAPVLVRDPETGRQRYWGSTAVVASLDEIMASEEIAAITHGYRIALRKLDQAGQPKAVAHGDPAVFQENPEAVALRLPYATWEIAAVPVGGWPARSSYESRIWSLTSILAGLLLLLIYVFQRMSRQREEAQRRLIQAINSLNDAFVMFDANNRLVQCNRRYRQLYNLPAEAVRAGTPRQDVIRAILDRNSIADAEGRESQWLTRRLRETRQPVSETRRRLSDGRWLRVTDVRMPDGFSVGLHTDITDLENARLRAEEASQAKSAFLSTVSHELRTPLTSIMGGLGLVLSGKLGTPDPRLRRLVQIAYDNCDRLTRLVNDILDMQKIESGRIEYSPEPLDLREMVEQAIESNRSYGQRFGVRYVLTAPRAEGAIIEADRGRFLQIMDNLLSNAAKFSNPGETVEVTVDCDDEECRIGVRDHGRGISPEQQEKLFVAFSQVDASDQREREGSGLGLAIAKRLVEDMGGRIGLTSALGEGSEFHVIFPLYRQPQAKGATAA